MPEFFEVASTPASFFFVRLRTAASNVDVPSSRSWRAFCLHWGVPCAAFGPNHSLGYALVNAVAVLIIACPCSVGLATTMSAKVGIGRGASVGILIRSAEALERMGQVDTVIVDKTGTLNEGSPSSSATFLLPTGVRKRF